MSGVALCASSRARSSSTWVRARSSAACSCSTAFWKASPATCAMTSSSRTSSRSKRASPSPASTTAPTVASSPTSGAASSVAPVASTSSAWPPRMTSSACGRSSASARRWRVPEEAIGASPSSSPLSAQTAARSCGSVSRSTRRSARATSAGRCAAESVRESVCRWRICSNERRVRADIVGERRAIRRSSANVMRSLPRRLASYSAASAACSRSRRSLPSPGQLATPNESVSRQPPRSMPARLRCRRRQTVRALAFVVSGSSSANSSPPIRNTLSAGRMPRRSSTPTSRRASSPATCPRVSLSSLKSSMSASTSAKPAGRAATRPRIVSWKLRWLARPGERVGGGLELLALERAQALERDRGVRDEERRVVDDLGRERRACRRSRRGSRACPSRCAAAGRGGSPRGRRARS